MRIRDWNTNLKIRLGGELLVNITFWMFFPFLAIYFSDEFGKTAAGLLLIASQSFAVLANLMGGYCADRFGRKSMMVLSSSGQGVFYLIFAAASSPWLDAPVIGFICFTAVSIFSSIYYPASQAMIADVVPEKDRSGVFAVFYTSINLAVVIGPILGSIFYAEHRFELLLSAGAANLILSFLLYWKSVETVPESILHTNKEARGGLHFLKTQLNDYTIILKDRTFFMFIAAGILIAMTFMQLDLLFAVYTEEVVRNQTLIRLGDWSIQLNGTQAFGLLLAQNGLMVVLLTIAVSKWMNRFKDRNVFVTSSLLYGVSMLIAGSSHWVWALILSMAVFTIAELMTVGLQNSFISKIAPEHMRGQYFAAASLRYTIGRMLAPLAIPMTVWFGNTLTFVILCILAFISAFIYHLTFRVHGKKRGVHVA